MNQEFDQYAKKYRHINDDALKLTGESSAFFAHYKAQKLQEWFPKYVGNQLKMLDFGCGDGVMTSFVKTFFSQSDVYGIDPSSESISLAQEQYSNVTFSTSYGTQLNFADNFFDLVYAAGTFHHIDFEDHQAYMQEIFRTLKPGGHFVLFELNPLNPATRYIFKHNPIDVNATMMSAGYSKKLLKQFGTIETKYYSFYPNFLGWMRPIEKYMTKIPFGALYACLVKKI